ncbi:MAG: dTMP kinase [Pseudomonadota bacterium]
MSERGRFITFEGIEGGGKSSHIEQVRRQLAAAGHHVRITREPGGTAIGEGVRELLLQGPDMGSDTELLLVFAARAQHVEEVVRPAIEAGEWVLCDRFTDASYAYQGSGRGIPWSRIAELEGWALGGLKPDVTLLFDLPVAQGLERAGRRSTPDRFEREELDFFERVRRGYLARAEAEPARFRIIDAGRSLEVVDRATHARIEQILESAHDA